MENCLNHLTSGFTVDGLIQQLINGLSLGSIYALIALGYSMVYGVLELINFAHGDVFMIGTFVVLGVVDRFGLTDQTSLVVVIPALLVAMIAAMALCAALGFTIEKVAYRPLRSAPRLAPLISAIGVSFLLEAWVATYVSANYFTLPLLIHGGVPILPDVSISYIQILMFVSSFVMMFLLTFLVRRTRLGRGMRAVAQDRDAAALMGVNMDRVISFTFVIGSALAGVAALLWTLNYSFNQTVGFIAGSEGVHRSRDRRHRQHSRRNAGRFPARPGGVSRSRLHQQPDLRSLRFLISERVRVRLPDPHARLPALRHPARARERTSMTATARLTSA